MSRTLPRPWSFIPIKSVLVIAVISCTGLYWNFQIESWKLQIVFLKISSFQSRISDKFLLVQPHGDDFRYSRLFHCDAVQLRCCFHCTLAMGDDDELRRRA